MHFPQLEEPRTICSWRSSLSPPCSCISMTSSTTGTLESVIPDQKKLKHLKVITWKWLRVRKTNLIVLSASSQRKMVECSSIRGTDMSPNKFMVTICQTKHHNSAKVLVVVTDTARLLSVTTHRLIMYSSIMTSKVSNPRFALQWMLYNSHWIDTF